MISNTLLYDIILPPLNEKYLWEVGSPIFPWTSVSQALVWPLVGIVHFQLSPFHERTPLTCASWPFLRRKPRHKTNAAKEIPDQNRILNVALKKFLRKMINYTASWNAKFPLLQLFAYVIHSSLFWSSLKSLMRFIWNRAVLPLSFYLFLRNIWQQFIPYLWAVWTTLLSGSLRSQESVLTWTRLFFFFF